MSLQLYTLRLENEVQGSGNSQVGGAEEFETDGNFPCHQPTNLSNSLARNECISPVPSRARWTGLGRQSGQRLGQGGHSGGGGMGIGLVTMVSP